MTTSTVKIPEEYLSFDYGFSGVDSPETTTTQPQLQPEVSLEVEEKLEDLSSKIDKLVSLMYRMEESGDERETEAELKDKIRTLEAIIVPLLNNLLKTAEKDYIWWPNRAPTISAQLEKVLKITRGTL